MNKKPIELHVVDGTKPRRDKPVDLPASIKKRIPQAEWLNDPDAWNKEKFIEETSDFLYEVYGIGAEMDKTVLSMLALHIETFVDCQRYIRRNNIIINQNNNQTKGPNPAISLRAKQTAEIVRLMNELGLTPRGRLSNGRVQDESPVAKFLKGPFAQ